MLNSHSQSSLDEITLSAWSEEQRIWSDEAQAMYFVSEKRPRSKRLPTAWWRGRLWRIQSLGSALRSQPIHVAVTKIPPTGRLMNNGHLFLMVPEAGKIWCPARAGSLLHTWPSFCVLTWQKERSSLRPLYKGTSPIQEGSTLRTQSLPKGPTS